MGISAAPTFIVMALSPTADRQEDIIVKCSICSILRSMFSGKVILLRNKPEPLFRVERKQVEEIYVTVEMPDDPKDFDRKVAENQLLGRLKDYVEIQADQWLFIMKERGFAMRNLDHLEPLRNNTHDLLWAKSSRTARGDWTGLLAVKGSDLDKLVAALKHPPSGKEATCADQIERSPLVKEAFEKGEVAVARPDAVDWKTISSSAYVTLPDWDSKDLCRFIQSLYFGQYFGDETGMMISAIES